LIRASGRDYSPPSIGGRSAAPVAAEDPPLSRPTVSIVVPVYNSEATLEPLLRRLQAVMEALGRTFEVIFVNDGSRDGSWQVVESLARRSRHVRGIKLARNYGQHNALLCGIRAARYEVIVTLDDDLQHPPEEIPRLLEALDGPFDVVYGHPANGRHGLLRGLASRFTKSLLQSVVGATIAGQLSAFRAFRTNLREAFAAFSGPHVSIDVLLAWGTTRFAAVRVDHHPRKVGSSNYDLRRLILQAVNLFTGFSLVPLRFTTYLGFACALLGVVALAWVLTMYLIHGVTVPGFAFLASLSALFAGAQMCCLGIMGEYLARIHFRLLDKPAYVVSEVSEEMRQAFAA
jgi:glycosyltransferase involved in cell wall biosynthesis